MPPTPGSTTARCTPDGHVRQRARQHEGSLHHRLRRDPVRDVDHARPGRDPLDHAVTHADEVVLEPEVGEEADDHAEPSLRRRAEGFHDRRDEAVGVVRLRLGDDARPPRRGRPRVVSGPIEHRGQRERQATERPGGRRRRQDDEVAVEAGGSSRTRAVERRPRRPRARPAGADARPRRLRTARARQGAGARRAGPSWVETRGDEVGAAERVGGRLSDRRDPARAPRSSAGAAPARRSRS